MLSVHSNSNSDSPPRAPTQSTKGEGRLVDGNERERGRIFKRRSQSRRSHLLEWTMLRLVSSSRPASNCAAAAGQPTVGWPSRLAAAAASCLRDSPLGHKWRAAAFVLVGGPPNRPGRIYQVRTSCYLNIIIASLCKLHSHTSFVRWKRAAFHGRAGRRPRRVLL